MSSVSESRLQYGDAIRHAYEYLLENHRSVFAIGQGLWSPWYVGNTMLDLDTKYGRDRVIDTPVSEAACTGAAIGASLFGYRPIVVHPRMDFMILAADQICPGWALRKRSGIRSSIGLPVISLRE